MPAALLAPTAHPLAPAPAGAEPRAACVERTMLDAAAEGRLRIVRELGRGSSGVVFLAHDRVARRLVAVKVLRHEHLGCDDHRARFRREAAMGMRLAGAQAHPGLLPVHALVERDEVMYLTMPFVHGESLGGRVGRRRALDVPEVHRLLIALADALAHLHRMGIVHRDLKAENVLVEHGTGRVVIIDFGVALDRRAPSDPWSEAGRVFGTPQYLSPEQAVAEPELDGRADLYALGVLGYLMTTGRLPFEGSTWATLRAQHLTVAAPRLPVTCATSRLVADVVARCLAKPREARPASGEMVVRALAAPALVRWPVMRAAVGMALASRRPLVPRAGGIAAGIGALATIAEFARRSLLCG